MKQKEKVTFLESIGIMIKLNNDKLEYFKSYLICNELALERLEDMNFSAIKKLSHKKKALINSINVLDERLLLEIDKIKQSLGISDLSELESEKYDNLLELRLSSYTVLKKTVEIKNSDESLKAKIDKAFDIYKEKDDEFSVKKLQSFTKSFFY